MAGRCDGRYAPGRRGDSVRRERYPRVPMPSQNGIYAALRDIDSDLDAELSWPESELPQRERTKHVHRLHRYLGKVIPQLVDVFLRRHFAPGAWVLDPFAGHNA